LNLTHLNIMSLSLAAVPKFVLMLVLSCVFGGGWGVADGFSQTLSVEGKASTQDEFEWQKVKPTGARAEFEMPIQPRSVERSFEPIYGKPPVTVRLYLGTVRQGKMSFIVGYHDLHEAPRDARSVNDALDGAVAGAIGNVMGQPLSKTVKTSIDGHPVRRFEYVFSQNQKRYIVFARVYLVGKRQYQVHAVIQDPGENEEASRSDKELAEKFLKSFKVLKIENDLPPRPRPRK
jgi:hypothetical protein